MKSAKSGSSSGALSPRDVVLSEVVFHAPRAIRGRGISLLAPPGTGAATPSFFEDDIHEATVEFRSAEALNRGSCLLSVGHFDVAKSFCPAPSIGGHLDRLYSPELRELRLEIGVCRFMCQITYV